VSVVVGALQLASACAGSTDQHGAAQRRERDERRKHDHDRAGEDQERAHRLEQHRTRIGELGCEQLLRASSQRLLRAKGPRFRDLLRLCHITARLRR